MSVRAASSRNLRRRQLDRIVKQFSALRSVPLPPNGWIAETRSALGMSTRQLGRRMGITQASANQLEHSEREGTITLNSLGKAAKALGCEVAYVFVPRESLERIVRDQAHAVASRIVGRVAHSMTLEGQGTGAVEREEAIAEMTDELVRTLSRELWD